MTNEEFNTYLHGLTSESILEPETFAAVLDASEEFFRAQRFEKLRKRARELGIKMKTLNELFTAFKKGFQAHKDASHPHTAQLLRNTPDWYRDGKLDELAFVELFNETRGLVCINGQLYSSQGRVHDEAALCDIQQQIAPYVQNRIAQKSNDLLKALKNFTYMEPPPIESDRIHVQNGCLMLDGHLFQDFPFTLFRLPVDYKPDAGAPEKWLAFVNELLEPEDVITLQKFLGYCLVPTTKAQKMLFLIGSGGEGKSVIGTVMKSIFGGCMVTGSLHDLDENRFALVSLENELVFLDDELSTNGCRESKMQKQLVTATAPVRVEAKGRQSYEAALCCRLMAFGNVPFNSLYDHSDGAYRRRIILNTKPKDPQRKDNRNLPDELAAEKDAIFLWAFQGLQRLIENGWEFTLSEAARTAAEDAKRDSFNFLDFLEDRDAIELGDPNSAETSADIYAAYKGWCRDNAEIPFSQKTVLGYLKDNARRLKVRFSNHVKNAAGGDLRGYIGIKLNRFIDVRDI